MKKSKYRVGDRVKILSPQSTFVTSYHNITIRSVNEDGTYDLDAYDDHGHLKILSNYSSKTISKEK